MSIAKGIKWLVILAVLATGGFFLYKKVNHKEEKKLFRTAPLERRTITHVINATGTLEAKGTLNIGSLVNGIVEKLYVEENQPVKKGQLLAKIDDGRGDTVVKQAAGSVAQAEATLAYQEAFFRRQKKLYECGQISPDSYESSLQNYESSKANLDTQKAVYAQVLMEFNNKKITSPIDGVVIEKNVSRREAVTTFSPPTILYTIAEDIRTMKVELEIDETDIGLVKEGQKAKLYFDTYPHKSFYGEITEISSAPIDNGIGVSYKATIMINNKRMLLKPGMTVHARITVGKAENALSVPGYLFSINKKLLEAVAKEKGYEYKPLTKEEKEAFVQTLKDKERPVKKLWVFEKNAFVQKPIAIGVTDNAHFEIIAGVKGNEQIVVDVDEPDQMAKMYKRLFGGGLGKKEG